jgi:hypothetical protein
MNVIAEIDVSETETKKSEEEKEESDEENEDAFGRYEEVVDDHNKLA